MNSDTERDRLQFIEQLKNRDYSKEFKFSIGGAIFGIIVVNLILNLVTYFFVLDDYSNSGGFIIGVELFRELVGIEDNGSPDLFFGIAIFGVIAAILLTFGLYISGLVARKNVNRLLVLAEEVPEEKAVQEVINILWGSKNPVVVDIAVQILGCSGEDGFKTLNAYIDSIVRKYSINKFDDLKFIRWSVKSMIQIDYPEAEKTIRKLLEDKDALYEKIVTTNERENDGGVYKKKYNSLIKFLKNSIRKEHSAETS